MKQKKYDVYGLGHALLDLVYHVPDSFLVNQGLKKGVRNLLDYQSVDKMIEKLKSNNIPTVKVAGGGSLANSLSTMQKFGANTYLCAKVADDQHGKKFVEELDNIKLKYSSKIFLGENNTKHTGVCLVMTTDDYERTMCTALGVCNEFTPNDLNYDAISESKAVYMEGYLLARENSTEVCETLCCTAKEKNVPIYISLCDPMLVAHFKEPMRKFIAENNIHCIFCNLEEAFAFTDKNTVEEAALALQKYVPSFVITLAGDGLYSFNNGTVKMITAYPTECVNTLGAGDCFAGGFLYAITHGYDFFEASEFANVCAAHVVSQRGPRLKTKYVMKILDEIKPKADVV